MEYPFGDIKPLNPNQYEKNSLNPCFSGISFRSDCYALFRTLFNDVLILVLVEYPFGADAKKWVLNGKPES